jgi:glycosyltransferase involved in cell wall biosynthesis
MGNTNTFSTVSIIIPVYNEEKTISSIIQAVKKANTCGLKKEIIIIDDGSKDGTSVILKKMNACKIFFHEKNKGKGAAIQTGLQHISGDIILIQDADLEYNPQEYHTLLAPILEGNASVVYGSRFSNKFFFDKNMYYLHGFGNKFLTALTNLLFWSHVTDMETCYKVMTSEVAQTLHLECQGFDIEPEITAKILNQGIHIHDVPISFQPRSFEEGKKIKWQDGITAAKTLIRCRFTK